MLNFIRHGKTKARPLIGQPRLEADGQYYVDVEPGRQKRATPFDATITTDSVVAKLVVSMTGSMRRLLVEWGDGMQDTLVRTPGTSQETHYGDEPALPPGTYEFHHAFMDGPPDGSPFNKMTRVFLTDASGTNSIYTLQYTLTPMFDVRMYATYFQMLEPFDTSGNTAEFEFRQNLHSSDGEHRTRFWRKDVHQNPTPTPWYRLEGSEIYGRAPKGKRVHSSFHVMEKDPGIGSVLPAVIQDVWPPVESKWMYFNGEGSGWFGSDKFSMKWYVDCKLSVPLPQQTGPVLAPLRSTRRFRLARKKAGVLGRPDHGNR